MGRRRRGDHRRARSRPSGARRLVLRAFHHLRLRARHGQDQIAAINFVEGAVKGSEAAFGTLIGPGFLDHFADATADDLPTNIAALRAFVRDCVVKPVSDDDLETAMCWNVVVPAPSAPTSSPAKLDCDDVLGTLNVPLLVTQGRADSVVLPATAEHVLTVCPTSEVSWYEGVGHVPFLEDPERFNRELAALTRRAHLVMVQPVDFGTRFAPHVAPIRSRTRGYPPTGGTIGLPMGRERSDDVRRELARGKIGGLEVDEVERFLAEAHLAGWRASTTPGGHTSCRCGTSGATARST